MGEVSEWHPQPALGAAQPDKAPESESIWRSHPAHRAHGAYGMMHMNHGFICLYMSFWPRLDLSKRKWSSWLRKLTRMCPARSGFSAMRLTLPRTFSHRRIVEVCRSSKTCQAFRAWPSESMLRCADQILAGLTGSPLTDVKWANLRGEDPRIRVQRFV